MMKRITFKADKTGRVRDFDAWVILENGVVVQTEPMNIPSFMGCKVDLNTLSVNNRLEYYHPRLGTGGIKWPVETIEEVTK